MIWVHDECSRCCRHKRQNGGVSGFLSPATGFAMTLTRLYEQKKLFSLNIKSLFACYRK